MKHPEPATMTTGDLVIEHDRFLRNIGTYVHEAEPFPPSLRIRVRARHVAPDRSACIKLGEAHARLFSSGRLISLRRSTGVAKHHKHLLLPRHIGEAR